MTDKFSRFMREAVSDEVLGLKHSQQLARLHPQSTAGFAVLQRGNSWNAICIAYEAVIATIKFCLLVGISSRKSPVEAHAPTSRNRDPHVASSMPATWRHNATVERTRAIFGGEALKSIGLRKSETFGRLPNWKFTLYETTSKKSCTFALLQSTNSLYLKHVFDMPPASSLSIDPSHIRLCLAWEARL